MPWPNWKSSCASQPCCCMAIVCWGPGTAGPELMKVLTGIAAAEFARRRRQLMRMAGGDAILVLPAAPERVRSHDTHYPYRQDSVLVPERLPQAGQRCWCWCRAASMARPSCSAASVTPNGKAGTARAPVRTAR